MRVLFQPRIQNFLDPAGGGLKRQVVKTAEFLKSLGVHVSLSLKHDENLDCFDIVHIFSPDTYLQAINAGRYRTPVVLSTIYWIDRYPAAGTLSGIRSKILLPARVAKLALSSCRRRQGRWDLFRQGLADLAVDPLTQHRTVLKAADFWLPNGLEEYRKIVSNTGVDRPFRIIPNAVDQGLLCIEERPVPVPEGDFALCVAAISPRKNQLELIRICRELGISLVLAGSCRIDAAGYFDQCRQAAGPRTVFAGELCDAQLAYLYRRARIHVLPSVYETPGLSSLEAALFGCPIVTTSIGAVYEYFGDEAFYCDPRQRASITEAVLQAWNAPRNELLRERVLTSYTWQTVARMTLAVYQELLGSGSQPCE